MAYEGDYLKQDPKAQMEWRQRQLRLARAVTEGAALAKLAEQEGVTAERIRQIVMEACVYAIRLPRPRAKLPPDEHRLGRVASLRTHKEFWRARLDSLERLWKLPGRGRRHRSAENAAD